MAGKIPQSFINTLIERIDPAEVIGRRVELRRVGNRHTGLCPFHQEKTPSFHVYADGYHCFGCGAHGTSLGFLMELDGLTFPEAVESLAALAGMEVPRERGSGPKVDTSVYDLLEAAAARYGKWLDEPATGKQAQAYLRERGLGPEVLKRFAVGLAPGGWDRIKTALASHGEAKLVDAGLLAKNDRGRTYDRFRERIVFPIRNTRGRVIGFGGRIFGTAPTDGDAPPAGGGPKYLNSPDTAHFSKGRELYGLFEARQAKGRLDSVVVVEGYMDVLALAQHGFDNAVATLGTAIGSAHFDRLFQHRIDVVTCCFDGDDAGRAAAWKAVDAAFPALSSGRQLRFAFLPDGEDPDSLVRRDGTEQFRRLIENATPVATYFLDHLRAGLDMAAVDGRALLCDLALPHIARLPTGALRDVLIADLARLSHADPQVLEQRLRDGASQARASNGRHGVARPSRLGQRLLGLLVKHPHLLRRLDDETRQRLLLETRDGSTLGIVVGYLASQPEADTAALLGRFVGEEVHAEIARLAAAPALLGEAALADDFRTGALRFLRAAQDDRAAATRLEAVLQSDSREDLKRFAEAKRAAIRRPPPASTPASEAHEPQAPVAGPVAGRAATAATQR